MRIILLALAALGIAAGLFAIVDAIWPAPHPAITFEDHVYVILRDQVRPIQGALGAVTLLVVVASIRYALSVAELERAKEDAGADGQDRV